MEPTKILRIVLASPGDVQSERDAVEPLVADLNRMFREAEAHVFILLSRWETDALPGLHREGPQGLIDQSLDIEKSDVLIGIFHKRFGTPVNDAGSGTEHEIRRAIQSFRSKGTPQVMLYFGDVEEVEQPLEGDDQWHRVNQFKRDMIDKEKALIWTYHDLHDFKTLLQTHLFKLVMQLEPKRMQQAGMPAPALRVCWKPEVVQLRAEGYTELLGDWFLYCTYEGSGVPERILHLGVIVFLNTSITSRPDDPVLFEVGRPGANAIVPCTGVHGNMVIFASVPLQGIVSGETRVFQISNLRCNATTLSSGATAAHPVMAFMSVTGTQIDKDSQEVGRIGRGLHFEVRSLDGVARRYQQSHSLPLTGVAVLRFTQGFPGAFKGRLSSNAGGEFHDGIFVKSSESCRLGLLFESQDGSIQCRGTAGAGTRLLAAFNNVPAGLRLFVSVSNTMGLGAKLVELESSLSLAASPEIIGGCETRELHIEQGSARAVWEVATSGWPSGASPIEFVVSAAYEGDPLHNRPAPGTVTVNGGFAPCPPGFRASAGAASSPSLPIPRFIAPWEAAINLFQIVFD